ncbi:hypothetical protein B0H13DRAFT_1878919 [Mycena leptocephala]|nr:hypothetical protein B0H13DRAFT_1878919 [Mycena leptocephala]
MDSYFARRFEQRQFLRMIIVSFRVQPLESLYLPALRPMQRRGSFNLQKPSKKYPNFGRPSSLELYNVGDLGRREKRASRSPSSSPGNSAVSGYHARGVPGVLAPCSSKLRTARTIPSTSAVTGTGPTLKSRIPSAIVRVVNSQGTRNQFRVPHPVKDSAVGRGIWNGPVGVK